MILLSIEALAVGLATLQAPHPGIRIIAVESGADALAIQERLERGDRFEDLAEEYSVDATAAYGGFLGRVAPEDLREEYRQVLDDLVPGQTSRIVSVDRQRILLKLLSESETEWAELARSGTRSFLQGRYAEAENFLRAALRKAEDFGAPDPRVVVSLKDLASFLLRQGLHDEAEALYLRALSIQESMLGRDHIGLREILGVLAALYMDRGRLIEAERLLERVAGIEAQSTDLDALEVVSTLNELAHLYAETGEYGQAEELYARALEIAAKDGGPDNPPTGVILDNLAEVFQLQRMYPEAEALRRRALEILEASLGPEDPDTVVAFLGLATVYAEQDDYAQFAPLYRRMIAALESALGPVHLRLAETLEAVVPLLRSMDRNEEADEAESRALDIRSSFGT